MAKAVPAPEPAPAIEGPVVYEPDEGMVISTVQVTRTQDAYVAVEHPEGWTEDQVTAALTARQMDFATSVEWWDTESTTSIEAIVLGENDPDRPGKEPFALGEPADEVVDDAAVEGDAGAAGAADAAAEGA